MSVDALNHLVLNDSEEIHVNMDTGEDIEIGELARIIKEVVGYEGDIVNDLSKPDGTPRKLLDVTKLKNTGYTHKVELKEGIKRVYKWYLESK
jgi:GDP-L-fucose synthase